MASIVPGMTGQRVLDQGRGRRYEAHLQGCAQSNDLCGSMLNQLHPVII